MQINYCILSFTYKFVKKKDTNVLAAKEENFISWNEILNKLIRGFWIRGYLIYRLYRVGSILPRNNYTPNVQKIEKVVKEIYVEADVNEFLHKVIALHFEPNYFLILCLKIDNENFQNFKFCKSIESKLKRK